VADLRVFDLRLASVQETFVLNRVADRPRPGKGGYSADSFHFFS